MKKLILLSGIISAMLAAVPSSAVPGGGIKENPDQIYVVCTDSSTPVKVAAEPYSTKREAIEEADAFVCEPPGEWTPPVECEVFLNRYYETRDKDGEIEGEFEEKKLVYTVESDDLGCY